MLYSSRLHLTHQLAFAFIPPSRALLPLLDRTIASTSQYEALFDAIVYGDHGGELARTRRRHPTPLAQIKKLGRGWE
jgi:hypothetical protein